MNLEDLAIRARHQGDQSEAAAEAFVLSPVFEQFGNFRAAGEFPYSHPYLLPHLVLPIAADLLGRLFDRDFEQAWCEHALEADRPKVYWVPQLAQIVACTPCMNQVLDNATDLALAGISPVCMSCMSVLGECQIVLLDQGPIVIGLFPCRACVTALDLGAST